VASERELPQRFPVRKRDGQWEVLISTENTWLSCETERDARIVARGLVLKYEALERTRTGAEFAAELDELADTLKKYRIDLGSRFFRRRADRARRKA
jgi:hypothetical protein